jgi:hypothetical protein
MDRYIKQLIEDLDEICNHQITLPFIEIPPEMQDFPEVAEYELGPNKSISEWIGADTKKFPGKHLLNYEQMDKLSLAMLKAFQTINVDVDLPGNLPSEARYDLLLQTWDEPVPYLSGPGYHLDFCSGDCDSCRIRKYCICYKSVLQSILP